MADHIFEKKDAINRLEAYRGKTLGEIDNKGIFSHMLEKDFKSQKGIAGTVVEQCIFDYPPDTKQDPDLIIVENQSSTKTELKSTGMLIEKRPQKHFVAKEPMSITGVGVYDIGDQVFETSHFWEKLEHMLIVYYHYLANHAVKPYEYKDFPVIGYEFHEFTKEETEVLKKDWEYVRSLCAEVVSHHSGPRNKAWKEAVKEEYIDVHGPLKRNLSYINLAPTFPPRFRLKKPVVSAIISKHFGYQLEQLPGRYSEISDIDKKCHELTNIYKGKTIGELADYFMISRTTESGTENKGISEQIIVAMFGGKAKKLNRIELFSRFGLIGKTVTMTSAGGRTEAMKLFHVDFGELSRRKVIDEDGVERDYQFEDSDLYAYFSDNEFLCIVFEEPKKEYERDKNGHRVEKKHPLVNNKFIGFKRLVFSEEFIDTTVRKLWEDTHKKIVDNTLVEVIRKDKTGKVIVNNTGSISTALNLLKSVDNDVYIKCSGKDTSDKTKTECVNGLHILPQYVWIKGTSVIDELSRTPEI